MDINKFCGILFQRICLNDIRNGVPTWIKACCTSIYNKKKHLNPSYKEFINYYTLWYCGTQSKHTTSIIKNALSKVEKILLQQSHSFDTIKTKIYVHLGFFGVN